MPELVCFHQRHQSISAEQIRQELQRELGRRKGFYPRRVDEGRMTQEESEFQLACAAAWLSDVERVIAFETKASERWEQFRVNPNGVILTPLPVPDHDISWSDRRAALEREINLRRRVYPRRVTEGAMTQAAADRQLACLLALADRYDDGLDWRASNSERPLWGSVAPATDAIRQARSEWNEHRQAVEARRQPAKQGEMAI